jgi:transcriptional regulator with XRE-family HTH domain
MTVSLLDTDRLVSARLNLKLSHRKVADEAGINANTLARLERGLSHEALDLGTLHRLAEALGLDVRALLRQSEHADEVGQSGLSGDALRLEALLLDARDPLRGADIAVILRWTPLRTRNALGELRRCLEARAARLVRVDMRYRIQARSELLTPSERRRLERAHHARYGLTAMEAAYLHDALDGHLNRGWDRSASARERYAIGGLIKAGLLEVTGDRLRPSEEAEFSLRPNVQSARQRR